jgi:phosphopantetheinyl transferase
MLAIAVSRIQDLPDAATGAVVLSASDRLRLHSLVSPARRRQFLAVRTLSQQLCQRQFGPVAADWQLSSRDDGSPALVGTNAGPIGISLTHSGDWVGCALADHPVGIDLQVAHRRGRQRDWPALASVLFSVPEQDHLASLPEAARVPACLERWSLAEAWCKQHRHGLDFMRTRTLRIVAADPGHAWTWSRMDQEEPVVLAVCCAGNAAVSAPAPGPGWHAHGAWRLDQGS